MRRTLIAEAGGRCALCGYKRCLINLHFHHVEPAQKSFALTTARGKSLAACREEAQKCVLVCANCHGEIEAGLVESHPPGARHGSVWSSENVVALDAAIRAPDVTHSLGMQMELVVGE